jgi:hypothetical protein
MNLVTGLSILDTLRCGLTEQISYRLEPVPKGVRQGIIDRLVPLPEGPWRGVAEAVRPRWARMQLGASARELADLVDQEGRDGGSSERGPPDPAPSTSPSGLKNTLYQRSAYAISSLATRSRVSSK